MFRAVSLRLLSAGRGWRPAGAVEGAARASQCARRTCAASTATATLPPVRLLSARSAGLHRVHRCLSEQYSRLGGVRIAGVPFVARRCASKRTHSAGLTARQLRRVPADVKAMRRTRGSSDSAKSFVWRGARWALGATGIIIGSYFLGVYVSHELGKQEMSTLSLPLVPGCPLVYMDISVNYEEPQRVVFQLRSDECPKAAENFRVLCTGEKGYSYANTQFFDVSFNKYALGGDFMTGAGRDSESIYGKDFEDEPSSLEVDGPGMLVMRSRGGPNHNGSQFYVSLGVPTIASKIGVSKPIEGNVVFGHVVDGMDTIRAINYAVSTVNPKHMFTVSRGGAMLYNVRIVGCGQLGTVPEEPESKTAEQ